MTRIWYVDKMKGMMWEGILEGYQRTYQAVVKLNVDDSGWLQPYIVPRMTVFTSKESAERFLSGEYTAEQRRQDIEDEILASRY
jgi:hypothetical protein